MTDAKCDGSSGSLHAGDGEKRKLRRRVRSGCRTCKIRKVKCDEGRPACLKCVSTGRVCEGYQVWGGGNALDLVANSALTKKKLLSMASLESQDERGFLEWFRCRTAVKMQGAFESPFWKTLVIQASLEEPSVFHSMLALSSVHKRVCFGVGEAEWESDPDRLEQFTLQQYSKAISHLLKTRPGVNGKQSTRVALICCMIFICLEILRGRYNTGNDHLSNGMKLLATLQENQTTTDDWLIEAFTRMNLLAVQFGQGCWLTTTPGSPDYQSHRMITFESVAQARYCLDSLLGSVIHLRSSAQRGPGDSARSTMGKALTDAQHRVKSGLVGWFTTYKASRVNFNTQLGRLSKIAYELLFLHYTMAVILADTCLAPADEEMVFDSHYQQFASIVTHSSKVLESVKAVHSLENGVFITGSESYLFNADIGWTPPLYYTALHCRTHSTRLRAIELLRVFPSKEGMWDSILAASISQKIMEMEEGYCCDSHCNSAPTHLGHLIAIPASHRIHDVQVALPEGPTGKVILTCKRNKSDTSHERITKEYDIAKSCWTNVEVSTTTPQRSRTESA